MGRGKYERWLTPAGLGELEELSARLLDKELAQEMDIAASTYYAWLEKYPEMAEAVTRGRTGAQACAINEQVEESLLKKALGYTVPLKKAFKVREVVYKNGKRVKETERIEYAVEESHIPADTAAIRFWLTNRVPERWKNKTDLSGEITASGIETFLQNHEGSEEL